MNMRIVNLKNSAIACAAGIAMASSAAQAETRGSSLSVSAKVTANCTVSTNAVAFGSVDTLSGSNVDASGGISVTCTNGTGWAATADAGGGTGATFASRKMASGSNLLSYSLYTDASRTSVWGDGTSSTAKIANTGTGSAQTVPVYGRVFTGQTSAPAGDYADVVNVTVTY